MEFCPVCKAELSEEQDVCPVCGSAVNDSGSADWTTLGYIEDKISADYALETLRSYDIPSVVFSRSGFFGSVGLPLNPFYNSGSALFEVIVPREYIEEASDILDMIIQGRWQKEES